MTRPSLPRTPNRLDSIDGSRPMDEQFLGMIVGLASEVTVVRARLDACERLLVASGLLAPEALDSYQPEAEAAGQREVLRKATLDTVFRPLREAAEAELAAIQLQETKS